ncbi:tyrosine-type recombinase/integrase [Methylobacterium bullatum]|uniref:Tyrosine recombinase XerC n=1 Tax=Methylobacterium bullatum TaxID=570505 RepID=A0A679JUS2_9HYPH|nr:Tyrosine recombinase XerC [Methylobacterium bullatum]
MRSDPEATISATIGRTVKASLRTRDGEVATVRRMRVLEALERLYASARTGEATLSHRQMTGLAGEVYGLLRSRFDDDPGDPAAWEAWKGFVRAARQGRIPTAPSISPEELVDEREEAARLFGPDLSAGIDALPPSGDRAALEDRCGRLTWWVLSRHGMHVDRATRLRILEYVADACLDAGWALKRAAQGDYTPDQKALRFPKVETRAAGITLTKIFDRWQKETKPAPSTITTWKAILRTFLAHVKHDDAGCVTSADIVAWKDARIASGRALKTIADSDLACLKTLFRYAVANRILTSNPVEGIRVVVKKKAGQRMLGYADADVARLLALSAGETHPARRWLPLLAALTGARVGELAALWGSSVVEREGVVGIEIAPSPDGSSLKNEGSERFVPLHPEIVRQGFVEYARSKGRAPLFYGKPAKGSAEGRHPSKGTANHLASWIRENGFTNERIAPAHGLRHFWKSTASRIGMADSIADTIQGHSDQSSAGTYRHISIAQMAAAVATIPIPTAAEDADGAMPVPPLTTASV